MENVKNLTGKKHRETFESMLKSLENIGYTNHWKVLNSKNYGTPQNRERVFVVSIRNDLDTQYSFPEPFDNGVRLRDVLEDEVDEKFYISDEKAASLIEKFKMTKDVYSCPLQFLERNQRVIPTDYSMAVDTCNTNGVAVRNEPMTLQGKDIGNTVRSGGRGSLDRHSWDMVAVPANEIKVIVDNSLKFVGGIGDKDWVGDGKGLSRNYPQGRRVYSPGGIAPTLNTCEGGNRQPKVIVRKQGVLVDHGSAKIKSDDISTCIDANYWKGLDNHAQRTGVLENYRIRKLTPKECLRLQCFSDEDHAALVSAGISNSQIYKVAGNSIAVCVVEKIFKALLCPSMSL
jgi:DNA (cytosine-5)-methyltransferase 1